MIYDVIVLGGGAAGLSAARTAADAGSSVVVLEARAQPGGRMRTLAVPGVGAVELGAEFVHGDAPITASLVRKARAGKVRLRGRQWTAGPDGPEPAGREWAQLGDVLAAVQLGDGDRTVADAIAAVDASDDAKSFTLGFLTGFDALDPADASMRAVLEEEGDNPGDGAVDSYRLEAGQEALLGPLAEGLDIRTRTTVTRVVHTADRVEVTVTGPLGHTEVLVGRRAVVALPLGVLKAGIVAFEPALSWPLDAVASGGAQRVVLVFRERFWDAVARRMGFLQGKGVFPTFWADARRAVITAWCGGPAAFQLSRMPEDVRVRTAVRDLAGALGLTVGEVEGQLRAWYTHDWLADPLARGAYSYVTVGGVPRLPELGEPRGSLHLAGEYVPGAGVSATVEAALASGRAAGGWAIQR